MGDEVTVDRTPPVSAPSRLIALRFPDWRIALWAGNAVFLLITLWIGSTGREESFLSPFYLAYESNIATWWSAAQLMLFGLMALSAGLDQWGRDRLLGQALIVLGALGLGLFADEIGSIHERVKLFVPLEGDRALIPFALVGAGGLGFALWVLRSNRDRLNGAWRAVFGGFAVLGSTYLHEFAEHRVNWPEWSRGFRVAAEEGTELLGMFVLLNAMVGVRLRLGGAGVKAPRGGAAEPVGLTMATVVDGNIQRADCAWLPSRRAVGVVLRVAMVAAIPMAMGRARVSNDVLDLWRKGDFGNVLPVLVFACGALIAIRQGVRAARRREESPRLSVDQGELAFADPARASADSSRRWWVMACVLLLMSLDAECLFHHYVARQESVRWRGEMGLLWGVPLIWAVAMTIPSLPRRWVVVAGSASAAIAVVGAMSEHAVVSRLAGHIVPLVMILPLWRVDGCAAENVRRDDGPERSGVGA